MGSAGTPVAYSLPGTGEFILVVLTHIVLIRLVPRTRCFHPQTRVR